MDPDQDSPGCQLALPLVAPELTVDTAPAEVGVADEPGQPAAAGIVEVAEHRFVHDRILIARIAAAKRWVRTTDRSAATAPNC